MPAPVMRMAPKPRRLTVMSPPIVNVPERAASGVGIAILLNCAKLYRHLPMKGKSGRFVPAAGVG
jgi:hypothetical protein